MSKHEERVGLGFVSPEGKGVAHVVARVARTWGSRLEGLLLTSADRAGALLLMNCPSVHTVGMRYAIDVALIGDGQVLRAERNVGPGRIVRHRGAQWALERPSEGGPWPTRGDVVRLDETAQTDWERVLRASDDEALEVA